MSVPKRRLPIFMYLVQCRSRITAGPFTMNRCLRFETVPQTEHPPILALLLKVRIRFLQLLAMIFLNKRFRYKRTPRTV